MHICQVSRIDCETHVFLSLLTQKIKTIMGHFMRKKKSKLRHILREKGKNEFYFLPG